MTPACPNCWPYRPCQACAGGVVPRPKAGRPTRWKATTSKEDLLTLVTQTNWNLTHAAAVLGETAKATTIIFALKRLAPDEYEAARRDGRIRTGRPINA
jgi:methylphosphotriester-DNA--protein-cysteine methyltransferase